MIISGQLDEVRARDYLGHQVALVQGRGAIALAVKHQSGDTHFFCQFDCIYLCIHLSKP